MSELITVSQGEVVPSYEGRPTVSQSEVDSFLRCARQHYYGYGLGIQRRHESDSLTRGKTGHAFLEVYFNVILKGGTHEEAYTAAQAWLLEQFSVNPDNIKILSEVKQTTEFFFQANPFSGWTVLAVEKEFVLSITDTLQFPFVIDLIARDPRGWVWIIDHKFIYDFISDRDAELMPQLPKYLAGLKAMGYQVDKIGFNQLRTRVQKEMNLDNKYKFSEVPWTVDRLRRFAREQTKAALTIQEIKQQPLDEWSDNALRTANKMVCNNCSFRSLCVAELDNMAPQLILDSEYTLRERREFKLLED